VNFGGRSWLVWSVCHVPFFITLAWPPLLSVKRLSRMEPQETQDFLEELLNLAIKPEFTYAHRYKLGDMLIIDNRSAMHKAGANFDMSQHRRLYRILVRGDRPF
jgi:alpha-ketoglutarate-dependent taurine dioxygenase